MNTKPSTIHRDTVAKVSEAIDNALVAAVHFMDANEDVNLDHILVGLAEARVYCIAAATMAMVADRVIDVADDQPRVYADQLPKHRDSVFGDLHADTRDIAAPGTKLPKLKPQGHDKVKYKPGISKMLRKPIEWDCPKCHAEAGTFCFKFDGPGAHPKLTTERNDGTFFHTMRSDLATAANDRIRKANILE